jgi:TetR/AcrR family transcriptional repressor of lmrAB and yxaGH operons
MAKDTRSRMLDVAADLVQDRGYHGLALADLLTLSKAPRGSLYFHFPNGKDQLIATATRDGIDAVTESLRAGLATEPSPGRAVRRLLEASAAALAASDFRFGSPTASSPAPRSRR